jgi:hypothetical protein
MQAKLQSCNSKIFNIVLNISCKFLCKIKMQYLSIMDFLRGQYVIYGPVRIILTEDEGQYIPKRSIYNICNVLLVSLKIKY